MKFSILLPVHNGIKYIDTFMKTFYSQNYSDCELLISENKCDDGTAEYLESITDFRVRIIHTESLFDQTENWNNAINNAKGEWVMLIGVDDGFPPHFFEIAEKLTEIADKKKLNIIKSNRVYYFWKDCQEIYGDIKYSYVESPLTKIKKTKDIFYKGLYSDGFYDMPQMYTTCFFRKSLVEKIFSNPNTNKKAIHYGSPDGYLGTLACMLEKKYLYTEMPLGWVGSSSSSQGVKDGHMKVKPTITDEEYNKYASSLYKTINSVNLLVAGAFLKANELGYMPCQRLEINEKKLLKNAFQKIKNNEEKLGYFMELLRVKKYDINEISTPEHTIFKIIREFIYKCLRKICSIVFGTVRETKKYSEMKQDDIGLIQLNEMLEHNTQSISILKKFKNMY